MIIMICVADNDYNDSYCEIMAKTRPSDGSSKIGQNKTRSKEKKNPTLTHALKKEKITYS